MLEQMKARIDALITKDLNAGAFAGASAAVYRDGECLYSGTFGMADRENGIPMADDSIFRIYSMTKPVTAAAVMQLAERGIIDLQHPVSRYIPEFSAPRVYNPNGSTRPAKREMTIQDLLNMQSGLTYADAGSYTGHDTAQVFGAMEKAAASGKPMDTMEFCRRIAAVPLKFDPGTEWEYGVSADILGGVVEVAAGMDYRSYLFENIFQPLGMSDTDFYVPKEKQHRFTAAYALEENALVRDEGCYFGLNDYRTCPAFHSGGAGLCSTVADYAKFANSLANNGTSPDGVRILSPRSVAYIRTPQVPNAKLLWKGWDSIKGYDYGALVRVLTSQKDFGTIAPLGEFGWDGWTGTYFTIEPTEKLVILFWIQVSRAGTCDTARRMRNAVYGQI